MVKLNEVLFSDIYITPDKIAYIPDNVTPNGLEVLEAEDFDDFFDLIEQSWDGNNPSYSVMFDEIFYRVERTVSIYGIQYCARKMPKQVPPFNSLGYPVELSQYLLSLSNALGLILCAGPTGAGKTTTISSLMKEYLTMEGGFAYTIEDPTEMPLDGVYHSVAGGLGLCKQTLPPNGNWGEGLKSALRSKPRFIMVGEIRALAAAELTFKGALSGHGVWSTLHANSAPAIITRFRDMGVQPYMLADPELMKGLISQRLFRKLCPHCRVSVKEKLNMPQVQRLKVALGDFGIENTYMRGPGCKFCDGRGIKGRMSVPEIILPDAMFLELMINGETRKAIDYWTSDLNGRPLKDAAIERMLKGYIDLDEVERWCGLLDQRPVY